jgi:hypothetical protein
MTARASGSASGERLPGNSGTTSRPFAGARHFAANRKPLPPAGPAGNPLLGSRRVKDIASADIMRFMRDIASGKTKANLKTCKNGRATVRIGTGAGLRTVGLLGTIFTYARKNGIIDSNPAHGVRKAADQRRTRLSEDELCLLGRILQSASEDHLTRTAADLAKTTALTMTDMRLSCPVSECASLGRIKNTHEPKVSRSAEKPLRCASTSKSQHLRVHISHGPITGTAPRPHLTSARPNGRRGAGLNGAAVPHPRPTSTRNSHPRPEFRRAQVCQNDGLSRATDCRSIRSPSSFRTGCFCMPFAP